MGASLSVMTATANVNNNGILQVNAEGALTVDSNLVNDSNGIIQLLGGLC